MLKKVFLTIGILTIFTKLVFAQSFCALEESKFDPKRVESLKAFRNLPILDQGRIKPLDTYAAHILLQFSGRRTLNKKNAVYWLADLIFAPASTQKDKIFLINNPDIPEALGIDVQEKRRYSFAQLNPSLNKLLELAQSADQIEEKERDVVEQEILRVYRNIELYIQFTYVTTFAFPHPDFMITDKEIIKELNLPEDQKGYSFVDIIQKADILQSKLNGLDKSKIDAWGDKERLYFTLTNNLFSWVASNRGFPLNIIASIDTDDEAWLSPWDIIGQEFYDERIQNEILFIRNMTVYYWNGKQLEFNIAAKALRSSLKERASVKEEKNLGKFGQELFYNKVKLFGWSKLLYGLVFLLYLLSLFFNPRWLRILSFSLIGVGIFLHSFGLILRMSILSRPPVSNLYETFIFVGFIGVICGIIIECINKRWVGIVVSSVSGLAMLMIAGKYSAEGDTLGMLVAVLNSNFWLSTHVISITIGYAGCCVAGVIGHLYVLQNIFKPKDKELLKSTHQFIIGTLGFGLTMTFLGTVLGGIWADQSWGRFWGWDPKENGALLIVLWSAIVFHAKIAKWIKPLGFAVGSILGVIVVMWAWFGVNLLGVGLHSYGFTSGIAMSLLFYVIFEILFIAILAPIAKKRLKTK
jgi:ABC-type transport system involved in cytochrome c biogenesis permease subunit